MSQRAERVVAQFELEDGGATFLVEVPPPISENAIEEVALLDEQIYKARSSFVSALDEIQPVLSAVASRLKSGLTTPADEVEVKFGLNLSADAGVIFSTVGGAVNFEVTLKWTGDSSKK